MIVRVNIALRNQVLNGLFNTLAGVGAFDGGTAEFRTGTQPAAADDGAVGTVVATVALAADAMLDATTGSVSKTVTAWQDSSADNSGTVSWVRFKSASGALVMDMDVTVTAGVGAVKVDSVTLVAGQQLVVTDFTLTMPATT